MTRPATDTLSLRLPKTRARSKRKRPRKPTGLELWFLGWTVYCIVLSIIDLLTGVVPVGIWQAFGAGLYWTGYQRERRGTRPSLPLPYVGGWLAAGLALIGLNFAGVIA